MGKKLIFSLFAGGLFFGMLELMLAVFGFGGFDSPKDPFVGFSGYAPLVEKFVDDRGQAYLVTSPAKLNWFNEIQFAASKPADTYRIFCLGGSTTYGHPYWDATSYSRWLREFLPIVDGSRTWEVVNAGGISYASYRVANVMEELAGYQPDAFIVFSAHNEFLERRTYAEIIDSPITPVAKLLDQTHTWHAFKRVLDPGSSRKSTDQLPIEVDEMLNHTIGPTDYHRDPQWRADVVRHYQVNLDRMVQIAEQCRAKLMFVLPASNTKDCSPFKSEVDPRLSESSRTELVGLLAKAYDRESRPSVVEECLRRALLIDPGYADAHYRLGRIVLERADFVEAEQHFRQARDHDVCPLRAVSEILATIEKVAADHKLPITDFDRRLRSLSRAEYGHDCLGEEYFLDHVHPTIDIHRRLALWMIEDMQAAGIVKGAPLSDASHAERLNEVRRRVEAEVDTTTEGIGLKNLAKTLHWAGRFEESGPLAEKALMLLTKDAECRFVLADSRKNLGAKSKAMAEYRRLFEEHPNYERAYHPYGELLADHGDWHQAKAYLLLAYAIKPDNAGILYRIGICHLELQEFDLAAEAFAKANVLYPNDPSTLFCLAQSLGRIGRTDEAKQTFRRLIEQGFDSEAVRQELADLDDASE